MTGPEATPVIPRPFGADGEDRDEAWALPPVESVPGTWSITIVDLMALLLTFFVLLFAMSTVKGEVWAGFSKAFITEVGGDRTGKRQAPEMPTQATKLLAPQVMPLGYLEGLVAQRLETLPDLAGLVLERSDERLKLKLGAGNFFGADGLSLSPDGWRAARSVADLLRAVGNKVSVTLRLPTGSDPKMALVQAATWANALRTLGYERNILTYGATDSSGDQPTLDVALWEGLAPAATARGR